MQRQQQQQFINLRDNPKYINHLIEQNRSLIQSLEIESEEYEDLESIKKQNIYYRQLLKKSAKNIILLGCAIVEKQQNQNNDIHALNDIRNHSHLNYEEQYQSYIRQFQLNMHHQKITDNQQKMKNKSENKLKNYPKIILESDPYYSHFILTSQSVKIRQDCQQLLNIDVKPFYRQMLQKRIPMHLWDQWIKNKLKQIIKENQH